MNTQPMLILIHGSWHDGSRWAQMQAQLAASIRSHAPTVRGPHCAANRRQTFGPTGGSEGHASTGELLAIHRADVLATGAEAA